MRAFFLAVAITLSTNAMAGWTIVPESSAITFATVKNDGVGEAHRFAKISGGVGDDGEASFDIDLASVNTGIEVRDQRLRSMLFEIEKFPLAQFKASLTDEQRARLSRRETTVETLVGVLSLHGSSAPVSVEFVLAPIEGGQWLATTTKPIIVSAAAFGLDAGIEQLRAVAGLQRIAGSVPVSLVLTLRPEADATAPKD